MWVGWHLIDTDLQDGPTVWASGLIERLEALLGCYAEFHRRYGGR